ncbi:hypothetical protein Acor_41030 [Acrocarpospora corrugata]|uniref:Uncharacterized protein n=1 Tax=Acrocarpospora corrugata TaxID=35763 RepID=A0A5M3W651_9ACTN|nr:hypothetical protein Acor_41030 [Acrocarpospora corrugata]
MQLPKGVVGSDAAHAARAPGQEPDNFRTDIGPGKTPLMIGRCSGTFDHLRKRAQEEPEAGYSATTAVRSSSTELGVSCGNSSGLGNQVKITETRSSLIPDLPGTAPAVRRTRVDPVAQPERCLTG